MKKLGLVCSIYCLLLFSVTVSLAQDGNPPLNEQLVTQMWAAFNAGDYQLAIDKAQQCITTFKAEALKQQAALRRKRIPIPPVGTVDDPAKRQEIFAQGLVNDVPACAFGKGKALEKLFETTKNHKLCTQAINAFYVARQFPYGRVWDPQGWFWSPAEGAKTEIRAVRTNCH